MHAGIRLTVYCSQIVEDLWPRRSKRPVACRESLAEPSHMSLDGYTNWSRLNVDNKLQAETFISHLSMQLSKERSPVIKSIARNQDVTPRCIN
jgi:hypothetical protein